MSAVVISGGRVTRHRRMRRRCARRCGWMAGHARSNSQGNIRKTNHILALIVAFAACAVWYPQTAQAIKQCRGGSHNVSSGVYRTTIHDDGERCPGDRPSWSCFGFEVAPGDGAAGPGDVATSGDAGVLLTGGARQPAVQVAPAANAAGLRRIPVGEVSGRSPSVEPRTIGTLVAPGILEVDPAAIVGKRLVISESAEMKGILICIGKWEPKTKVALGFRSNGHRKSDAHAHAIVEL